MCLAKTITLNKNQLKIALSWNQDHTEGNAAAKLRAAQTIIKMSDFPPIIKTYYFFVVISTSLWKTRKIDPCDGVTIDIS